MFPCSTEKKFPPRGGGGPPPLPAGWGGHRSAPPRRRGRPAAPKQAFLTPHSPPRSGGHGRPESFADAKIVRYRRFSASISAARYLSALRRAGRLFRGSLGYSAAGAVLSASAINRARAIGLPLLRAATSESDTAERRAHSAAPIRERCPLITSDAVSLTGWGNGGKAIWRLKEGIYFAPLPPSTSPVANHASCAPNGTGAVSGVSGRIGAVVIAMGATSRNLCRSTCAAIRFAELRRAISARTRPRDAPPGPPVGATGAVSGVAGRLAAIALAHIEPNGSRHRATYADRSVSEFRRAILAKTWPLGAPPGSPTPASCVLNATDAVSGVAGRIGAVVIAKSATPSTAHRSICAARLLSELRRATRGKTRPRDAPPGSPTPASRVMRATDAVSGVAGRVDAVVIAQRATAKTNHRSTSPAHHLSVPLRVIYEKTRTRDSPPGPQTQAPFALKATYAVSGASWCISGVADAQTAEGIRRRHARFEYPAAGAEQSACSNLGGRSGVFPRSAASAGAPPICRAPCFRAFSLGPIPAGVARISMVAVSGDAEWDVPATIARNRDACDIAR